jgi:hypothetical protein
MPVAPSAGIWWGVTAPMMALGLLLNLCIGKCALPWEMYAGFPYLTHASCFSSIVLMSWALGCAGLPSLGVEAPCASARG